MILKALVDYYKRSDGLPREGWTRRTVDYELVLDTGGNCVAFKALGEIRKGKKVAEERLVTAIGKQAMKHTNSGKDANLLWDNASFVFGAGNKGATKLANFIETLQSWLGGLDDPGVKAVHLFCTQLQENPEAASALIERFGHGEDFEKRDPVLTFQLQGDLEGIHHRPSVRTAYEDAFIERGAHGGVRGNCLVTGKTNVPIALNETVIKNVWGGQPAGCNIVSFNARAFESYGKTERQGENAPVSRAAAFAYTTALNHLLRKDSPQRMQVGDASTVFWAERQDPFETIFGEVFQDNPDANTDKVEALLKAVHSGHWGPLDKDLRYHVLGLAPNAARISIRFYHCVTLQELGQRIAQHFEDLALVRGPYDPQYPSLKRLLQTVCLATSSQPFGDIDRLPPNLGGAVVDAIFAGENVPFPSMWLNAAVGRCRAEQAKRTPQGAQAQNVPYARAAVIKACLNRQQRHAALSSPSSTPEKELLPMLDLSNTNPAYRLGRLFAVLERIQEESAGGPGKLNATIRDRFYGAASTSPATVFPMLLKLKNHHVSKLEEKGRRMLFRAFSDNRPDDYIGQITQHLAEIPLHLKLADQGRFALGYYHQRRDFFHEKPDESSSNNSTPEGPTA